MNRNLPIDRSRFVHACTETQSLRHLKKNFETCLLTLNDRGCVWELGSSIDHFKALACHPPQAGRMHLEAPKHKKSRPSRFRDFSSSCDPVLLDTAMSRSSAALLRLSLLQLLAGCALCWSPAQARTLPAAGIRPDVRHAVVVCSSAPQTGPQTPQKELIDQDVVGKVVPVAPVAKDPVAKDPLAKLFSTLLFPGGQRKQIFFGVLQTEVDESSIPSDEERAQLRAEAAANLMNINMPERDRRRLAGTGMSALTALLAVGLLATHAGPAARLAIAPPLFLSYGYLASAQTGL